MQPFDMNGLQRALSGSDNGQLRGNAAASLNGERASLQGTQNEPASERLADAARIHALRRGSLVNTGQTIAVSPRQYYGFEILAHRLVVQIRTEGSVRATSQLSFVDSAEAGGRAYLPVECLLMRYGPRSSAGTGTEHVVGETDSIRADSRFQLAPGIEYKLFLGGHKVLTIRQSGQVIAKRGTVFGQGSTQHEMLAACCAARRTAGSPGARLLVPLLLCTPEYPMLCAFRQAIAPTSCSDGVILSRSHT